MSEGWLAFFGVVAVIQLMWLLGIMIILRKIHDRLPPR